MKESKYAYIIVGSLLLTIAVYSLGFAGYFQQDEWLAFGNLIARSDSSTLEKVISYFALNSGHYVPFHQIVFLLFYKLFSLNYIGWFTSSLVWHLMNIYLLYRLMLLILNERKLALAASTLWGVSASIYQATTWIGANINTQGATTFGIVSAYFFYKLISVNDKQNKTRYLIFSILLFVFSLLFKEITLGLIAVYVVTLLLQKNKNLSAIISYLVVGILYLSLRVYTLFLPIEGKEYLATNTQSLTQIIYNGLTFPFKAFSQTILPQKYFIEVGYYLAQLYPKDLRPTVATTEFDIFAQKIVLEGLSVLLFGIVMALIYKAYKKTKQFREVYIFSLLFVIFNSMIYALSPERVGRISIMDSRNMYFPAIGVFLIITLLMKAYVKSNKQFVWGVVLIATFNIIGLTTTLSEQIVDAKIRKTILTNIDSQKFVNLDKVVLYTESNSSYFGLPEDDKILPFQSGFGQTLLVYFSDELELPSDFYTDYYLWDLKSQEYKEVNGRGFGYFRDFDKLQEAVNKYNIDETSIVAYSWNGDIESLVDITDSVRNKLQ